MTIHKIIAKFNANRIRKTGLEFEENNEVHSEHIRFEVLSEHQYSVSS